MNRTNPSRQRKKLAQRTARKGKSEKGYGGTEGGGGGGGRKREGKNHGTIQPRTNRKHNRQLISKRLKYKHRRAAKQ